MSDPRLLESSDFKLFWASDSVSMVGSSVTMVALQPLGLSALHATGTEMGVLRAASWLPYLLFGLIAGVLVDRCRRKPILVGADLGRFALVGLIPLLAALDRLTMPTLIVLMMAVGTLSLAYDAAHQSFLPRLVPTSRLTEANARLQQTDAVAQVAGPALAGALVQVVSAATAMLVDAVSYLVSGLLLARVRVEEPVERPASRHLGRELREGLSWMYTHRMLAPMAVTTHVWFLCNAMVTVVTPIYMYRVLGFSALEVGVTVAAGGVGGVVGALLSTRIGRRFGTGPTIVAGKWLTPLAYLLIPLAGNGIVGLVLLAAAQLVFGFSIGMDSPVEMGYWQSVTPDRLQGRVNGARRSLNRGAIVLGGPLGGALSDWLGVSTVLWIGITGLAAQAVALTLSPVRTLRSTV